MLERMGIESIAAKKKKKKGDGLCEGARLRESANPKTDQGIHSIECV